MNRSTCQVSPTLARVYSDQYSKKSSEWRMIGAKHKAANIIQVCGEHRFRKVLDCGAGEGSILQYFNDHRTFEALYALEISDSGLSRIANRQLEFLREAKKFDGYHIPFAEKEFDLSYCSHVIEHVEHPRLLLRDLRRVSRFQIFEIPLDFSFGVDQRVNHYLSYGHINIFTPSLFKFLLKSEGFEIIDELLARQPLEMLRYSWFNNQQRKVTTIGELQLCLYRFLRPIRRLYLGQKRYREMGFDTYTCLARGAQEFAPFASTSQ